MSLAVKPLDGNFLNMANAYIVSSNTNTTTDLSLTMFYLQLFIAFLPESHLQ